jgi:hypothetical protein
MRRLSDPRHHAGVDLNQSVLAIIVLAIVAGGGIIVIDWFVIRKIRRLGLRKNPHPEDPRIDQ